MKAKLYPSQILITFINLLPYFFGNLVLINIFEKISKQCINIELHDTKHLLSRNNIIQFESLLTLVLGYQRLESIILNVADSCPTTSIPRGHVTQLQKSVEQVTPSFDTARKLCVILDLFELYLFDVLYKVNDLIY